MNSLASRWRIVGLTGLAWTLAAGACGPEGHRVIGRGSTSDDGTGAPVTPGDASASTRKDASVPMDAAVQVDPPKDAAVAKDAPASPPDLRMDPPDMRPAADMRPPIPMTPPAPALGADAVAYWTFDEGFGDQVADSSGSTNHAVRKAGTLEFVEGKHGWAAKLGAQAFLEAKPSATLDATAQSNQVTVAAWIKPSAVDAAKLAFVFSRREAATNYELYGLSIWNGVPSFNLHFQRAAAVEAAKPGEWMHLAGTYDGAFIRVYVNGVEAGSNDEVLTIPADVNPGVIGANVDGPGPGHFFDGLIDDLRIYKRALTAQEIAALAK